MRVQMDRLDRELDRARARAREEMRRLRGQRGEILPLSAVRELQALFDVEPPTSSKGSRRGPIAVGPITHASQTETESKN
jgi:hypothetical protein